MPVAAMPVSTMPVGEETLAEEKTREMEAVRLALQQRVHLDRTGMPV